jgi:hypothetical protein
MRILFTVIILFFTMCTVAQNIPKAQAAPKANILHVQNKTAHKDTVIESDTSKENQEPRYFYFSANTNVYVNSKGGFAKRFAPSLEFGRTYGIFDIGLATGRINTLSSGSDTTRYLEFRPTINVFSKGRFAEALCLGGGIVFNGKQGLMTEIENSINFNISEIVAVAVVQGYMSFDGTNSSRNTQYMGFSLTYNLIKKHSVNKQRKRKALISDN